MDFLRLHAKSHPDWLALTDLYFERQLSYRELDKLVASTTSLLLSQGISEGDRVACLSKNRAELVFLHFACARLGAIFVPLNWRLSVSELDGVLSDCEPAVVYADRFPDTLDLAIKDIDLLYGETEQMEPTWPEQKSPDNVSLMLYTSGTTGMPKGVMLSERNLFEAAINFALLGEVDSHSHFLCESPMFHIIGMVTSLRPALMLGGHITISDGFIPERTFNYLADRDLGVTHYFCVPQMARSIRAVDGFDPTLLTGLRAIFTGGAPHPEAQIRDWITDGVVIVDGYGMSEAGTVFGMPLDKAIIADKAGSVGFSTPRVQTRIVDDFGVTVPAGVPGELQIKGDNVTRGYWRKEAEFKKVMTDDGWFKTGDILTCDDDGYYRVTDRKKDMYISGGENVYPAEVEAQLVTFTGVQEFAVIGVPDKQWGEVGCLFYVPTKSDISLDQVEAFLSDRLAKYKIPKKILKIDCMPRNAAGKLMRHQLRRVYETA